MKNSSQPDRDQFVVAFQGRRDNYQVPLALAEAGMLGRFVTGVYAKGWTRRILGGICGGRGGALERRRCEGIPDRLVASAWWIEVFQKVLTLCQVRRDRIWRWGNRRLSLLARRSVERHRFHLLAYEPYAWEAFTAALPDQSRKVLFHFHIHPEFERRLISADSERYPMAGAPWERRVDALPADDARVVDLWRHADRVICASSFTKQTLVDGGMPEGKAVVVPYGIDVPDDFSATPPPPVFSVLFVGGGVQRKGIHHLIQAWQNARLPQGAKLTLVCRNLDGAIEALIHDLPADISLSRGVAGSELMALFRNSSLFAMPSLVEGFGQVYLEALASGCPVLGTAHSGLPDLGTEEDGIFLVEPGDVEALREKLETLASKLSSPDSAELRARALATARRFPWARFRSGLVEAISDLHQPI